MMLTQKDLVGLAKAAGYPLTGQTLRNYIKAEVCLGAIGVKGGVPGKGITTRYELTTSMEAIVAKDMLTKSKRQLTMFQVAFARKLAIMCITDKDFNPLNDEDLKLFVAKSGCEVVKPVSHEFVNNTVTNGKEYVEVWHLLALAAEWLIKYCSAEKAIMQVNFAMLQAGAKLEIEQLDRVLVCAGTNYVVDGRGLYGFVKADVDAADATVIVDKRLVNYRTEGLVFTGDINY